ncbi:FKBP-type peptidyl-prolyl cis-trans isomerase FkpA [Mucilaginibacter frigoritolerans]|jgi:FKBP-type peptidyl-prolyl cis-trans isomerase FkpA|uniref:Peptidyl-prolyl cis-trans isomerase n=1 Tax=Mucilaginibacter frigoritolerans TaxID=652788 RepID=A0A562U6Q0_9SPHI|nr:FKBP-type peptidyl-prolyl cis-trans isomerase [Mucilaginibacter frigoritolerans]TWJ01490.1 FKBP-type peptidyl-prolyl cis-trans isomerase FkpA [Mucilaginibacter frigoritolerans]
MNRILLILLLFAAGLSGCSKSTTGADQVAAQLAIDTKIITNYLQANNITAKEVDSANVVTGIYYTIDTVGTGVTPLYTNSTQVTIGYTGYLLNTNGTVAATPFVQTKTATTDFHPSYVLGAVIEGWALGFEQAKVPIGSTFTLYIPSKYAYGPYAQPQVGLPANAVLIFHIKVYNVTN